MRSVVRTLKPQAFSNCLTKNATKAIVIRQMGNMARYASYTSPSCTLSSISRFNARGSVQGVQGVRFYATEAEEVLKVPFLADSITKGEVAKIFKKVGDTVKRDDTILSLDTDKTSAEINAPYTLIIVEILTKEGDSVEVGQALVKVKRAAADAAPTPKADAPKAEAPKAEAPKAETPKAEAPAPKAEAPAPKAAAPAAAPKAEAPKPSSSSSKASVRTETREKMPLIRQRTAQRLKDSQNTAAMLTSFQECDTSAVAELRAKFGEDFLKKHGVKLGFMSVFVKASVAALQDQPIVNAFIQDKEIVYRSYNDISVAVATPRGLVVPVLRDCQNKSMADIEKELGELGARARLNQVSIEEMVGGTFTISNGGVYGSLMGTPIINPPQSAILGMHGIFKRPVVVNDKVEIRPMMYIALTYDHRLIDGREAVTFLRKVKDIVEDPRRLLLEL